jgi:hypothetical protein
MCRPVGDVVAATTVHSAKTLQWQPRLARDEV